ncbi:MAG: hypothetical protein V1882_09970 [Candidatus Omnitrophota bacterium]
MKRLGVFLIGAVLGLLCLEAGLRGLGVVYRLQTKSSRTDVPEASREPFVVLCFGNSYTKGSGSNDGMSYPEQLQRLLFNGRREKNAVVLNLGRSNQNTTELLAELDANLQRFKPNLVLLQTGQANCWNHLGYTDYLKREGWAVSWAEKIRYSASEIVYSSSVYRLFLLWREHVSGKKNTAMAPEASVDISYRGSPEYLKAMGFVRKTSTFFWRKDSVVNVPEGREALKVFMSAVEKDPSHPLNYVYVGCVFRFLKDYEEALRWFVKGVNANVRFRSVDEVNEGYREIIGMRLEDKGRDQRVVNEKIDAFIKEFNRKNPDLAENLLLLTPIQLEQWVASDVREIVRKIQASGAVVVLQNYPVGIPENDLLRRIAERDSLLFVDHFAIFEKKMREGVPREALFVPDNHCNDAGYGLMAENVYQGIVDAGF